ncbi:stage II sporulation protein E [uncultured Tyzzerella sp.]|uniref:stage II sporulation protein E n=1 Tax=uncultured Tyzzerella sp. TaxID=2321398 RepID=UPI002942E6F6|nr:stage II sporulation protein E [uncultured Tyzzerella sp.]
MEKYLRKYTSKKTIGLNFIFIILSILGFFIGRVSIFHMLNPIAIAYLGCLLLTGKMFNLSLAFTFLGFFSKIDSFYITKYIICLFILFFINILFCKSTKKNSTLFKSILCSISIFISGIIISFLNGFSTYYLILATLETILTFCMFFILNKGISYLNKDNKTLISNEEIISIGILIGSIICGSSDVFLGNVSFTYFFIITLLLFVCYIYGSSIGAIVSMLSSFLLFITNSLSGDIIIILTVSSILSSLVREKGKFILSITFSLCVYILSLIIDISLIDNILFFSIISSNILFLSIPCNIKANISFSNITKAETAITYTDKLQILTSNKLNNYASSFEKLSKTFYNLSEKKTNLDQQDISNLIDEVASKVCNNCQMKVFCWEKNFYSTYQNIFSILNMYEKTGQIEKNSISYDFIENCININQFIDVLNKKFEIYKLNLSWKNKVIESRELVGKQLTGISSIIYDLSKNLCENVSFKENYETKIKYALENNGIATKNVIITENNKGKLEVLLKVEPCYVPNKCTKTILPIVSEILGKKMCKPCYDCIITKENNESVCSISLVEEQKFRVSSYAITASKDGSNECGDSHSFLSLPNGTYLLALSDGMGSGKNAKIESMATIELLEDFLQAGFSKDLAINMINSVLFLKSSKDTFSTLDMCTIDLYTGFCEILKIGAVSTLILHNNKVDIIKSNSLPVGILNNVEPEIRKKKLSNGDIIVMVTDGVIDSTNNIINKENWIIDILLKNTYTNPEDVANAIFEKTKENYKNNIKDDITILVARIWE